MSKPIPEAVLANVLPLVATLPSEVQRRVITLILEEVQKVHCTDAPDTYTLALTKVGSEMIGVIKAIRTFTNLGLKEAKDLVDRVGHPSGGKEPLLTGLSEAAVVEYTMQWQAMRTTGTLEAIKED